MAQILTPVVLLAAALHIANISSPDEVSADIQYGNMASKASQKTNGAMTSATGQTPSWAIGARLHTENLGVQKKRNLVGKTLIQKNDKVGNFNFFDDYLFKR